MGYNPTVFFPKSGTDPSRTLFLCMLSKVGYNLSKTQFETLSENLRKTWATTQRNIFKNRAPSQVEFSFYACYPKWATTRVKLSLKL